jgi:AhpD family alkylhydroperoxidase
MPRVSVPPDRDPLLHVWGHLAPELTAPAGALSAAVYGESTLSLREFEAARIAVARANDCQLCLGWRSHRDAPRVDRPDEVPEELYAAVLGGELTGLSSREALAAEYADRFVSDHLAIDDDLWDRLHRRFSDDEIVDLSVCVGSWLAFGRINRVLDVDGACRVDGPAPG